MTDTNYPPLTTPPSATVSQCPRCVVGMLQACQQNTDGLHGALQCTHIFYRSHPSLHTAKHSLNIKVILSEVRVN